MLGVLYPYAHIVPYAIGKQCSYIIYNTLWRGLAELLISLGRQCEGLVGGISGRSFSHVFLMSISQVLTLMLKQGEW